MTCPQTAKQTHLITYLICYPTNKEVMQHKQLIIWSNAPCDTGWGTVEGRSAGTSWKCSPCMSGIPCQSYHQTCPAVSTSSPGKQQSNLTEQSVISQRKMSIGVGLLLINNGFLNAVPSTDTNVQ